MTIFSTVEIGGIDRKNDVLRADLWRTISSVGNWQVILRNIDGKYNEILPTGLPNNPNYIFDVQDNFKIAVDDPFNILMEGKVDGPAVTLRGADLESVWDEYVVIKGVDQAQDLMFHNDFEYSYSDTTWNLHQLLSHLFLHIDGLGPFSPHPTNIQYDNILAPIPTSMVFEFKKGVSLLSELQELTRMSIDAFGRSLCFYVDDTLWFRAGPPGEVKLGSTGYTIQSDPANLNSNVIDAVEYQTRDGDKHYNYVEIFGKSPMFDGYTEYNASSWLPAGGMPAILDDSTTIMVGAYSQVACNTNPLGLLNLQHILNCPIFNYNSWDLSSGELGTWARYDNTAGAPGTPAAGSAGSPLSLEVRLTDINGAIADYFSDDTTALYVNDWGYCTFPLGEKYQTGVGGVNNTWCVNLLGTEFDWAHVTAMNFHLPKMVLALNRPSHLYLDGIGLPFPIRSIKENAGAQVTYRRRPYIDTFPNIRTQNVLDRQAEQIRAQSESTLINKLKVVVPGDENIRYAGQSINVNIPKLGIIPSTTYYITQLHHIIEPYVDVSQKYGFDWIVEIDCAPVQSSTPSHDMSRLGIGQPLQSPTQKIQKLGVGMGRP